MIIRRNRAAFTLVEILFVIVVIGIVAAVVIPRSGRGDFYEYHIVQTTARQMVADLRLARRLAISHGSTNSSGYSFDLTGGSPYTGWRILDESDSSVVGEAKTIDPAVRVTGISNVAFDTVGGASYSATNITLQETKTPRDVDFEISITKDTGRIWLEDQS